MGPHHLEQARVDGGPDGAPLREAERRLRAFAGARLFDLAEVLHVLDRDLDPEVECLSRSDVDDGDRPRLPRPSPLASAEVARHFLEGPLGGGKADPLQRPSRRFLEPLEGERQMGAALRPHENVDLVDDHHLDRREEGPRLRRQDEEERFRGRDQDVGRLAGHAHPLGLWRIAGSDRELGDVARFAPPARHPSNAGDR